LESNQIIVSLEKLKFTLGLGEKRKEEKGEEKSRIDNNVRLWLWISPRIQYYDVCEIT